MVLFYLHERSYEEVARTLAIPMGTVKTYLHRARKQLIEQMAGSNMEKEQH
jgi:DNA-directed RNA polymerase specialized sigma24 family protein